MISSIKIAITLCRLCKLCAICTGERGLIKDPKLDMKHGTTTWFPLSIEMCIGIENTMGNKLCKMCSIAWDIRGKHAHACALKMCTTHGCVSLHMGKPRDYNLVKYMGSLSEKIALILMADTSVEEDRVSGHFKLS